MNQRMFLMVMGALVIFVLGLLIGMLAVSQTNSVQGTGRESPVPVTPSVELSMGTPRPPMFSSTTSPNPENTPTSAEITREQAADIAIRYVGGGTIHEIDLDDEGDHGAQVYEVNFSDGSEVYINAITGDVVYARLRGSSERERHEERDHDDDH